MTRFAQREINEEDINFTLDQFAYELMKQPSFKYVAKIISPNKEDNSPTGYCFEIGYQKEQGEISVPNNVDLITTDYINTGLKIKTQVRGIKNNISLIEDSDDDGCSIMDTHSTNNLLIGGGGICYSFTKKIEASNPGTLGAVFQSGPDYYGLTCRDL